MVPVMVMLVTVMLLAGVIPSGRAQGWELRVCAEPDSLPYSNKRGEGFENRIAEIVAQELGAKLTYVWLPQPHPRARDVFVQEGRCDLVMGVPDGHPGFLTSLAYYRTTYVFVYRRSSPFAIKSYNDPKLKDLKIGVQLSGSSISPSSYALAKRGLIENQVGFAPNSNHPDPLSGIVRAVAEKKVDVAVAWGPVAGFFAKRHPRLEIVSVRPQIEAPYIPMVASISVGLRMGDEGLRDSLDEALARRWDDIQRVLRAYGVPLEPLSPPTLNVGAP
jgi:mxaJ protein